MEQQPPVSTDESKDTWPAFFAYTYVECSKPYHDILCCLCEKPLEEPVVEPSCRNMFCRVCITSGLQRSHSCPQCRQPTSIDAMTLPPRMVNNVLDRLLVICPSCDSFHKRKALLKHLASCRSPCALGCGELIKYANREQHEKKGCSVACLAKDVGCKFLGALEETKAHEATCVPLVLRGTLHEHRDEIKALRADFEMLKHAVKKTDEDDEEQDDDEDFNLHQAPIVFRVTGTTPGEMRAARLCKLLVDSL